MGSKKTATPNLVTRQLLRERFAANGRWYTMEDLTRKLVDAVPHEAAVRYYERHSPTAAAKLALADRIFAGRRLMVSECVSGMAQDEQVVTKEENGIVFIRVKPKVNLVRKKDGRLPPEAFTRPALNRVGVSTVMVRQLVADNPGITQAELCAKLAKCWKDDGCKEAARVRGGNQAYADRERTVEENRMAALGSILTHLTTDGSVRLERPVLCYPSEGTAEKADEEAEPPASPRLPTLADEYAVDVRDEDDDGPGR